MDCTIKMRKEAGEILDEYYGTTTSEKLGVEIEVSIVMPWGEDFGEQIEKKIQKSVPKRNGLDKKIIEALKISVSKMVEELWLEMENSRN